MSLVSFICGGMTVMMAYAFFHSGQDKEMAADPSSGEKESSGRYVTLSCQSCRKLKRHLEIEQNLYECSKCKRLIDLRRVS
jgi:acetyl-CoA carboxylase beta subunit